MSSLSCGLSWMNDRRDSSNERQLLSGRSIILRSHLPILTSNALSPVLRGPKMVAQIRLTCSDIALGDGLGKNVFEPKTQTYISVGRMSLLLFARHDRRDTPANRVV